MALSEATAGLIGSGLGLAGEIFGGISANQASAKSAEKAAKLQLHMLGHRYQYTMEDMRRAGLNPILAYKQGATAVGSAPPTYTAQNVAKGASGAGREIGRMAALLHQEVRKATAEADAAAVTAAKTPEIIDTDIAAKKAATGLSTGQTSALESSKFRDVTQGHLNMANRVLAQHRGVSAARKAEVDQVVTEGIRMLAPAGYAAINALGPAVEQLAAALATAADPKKRSSAVSSFFDQVNRLIRQHGDPYSTGAARE